jgi:hypothetical protein
MLATFFKFGVEMNGSRMRDDHMFSANKSYERDVKNVRTTS